jgi:RNA polymerase sigma-70 factor (ECF subfamily)
MDPALVVRAQRGDAEAFAAIAVPAMGRMTAVARLVLRDGRGAEEAVQDALLEAWRDLPRLRQPERFEAWLRRLLLRACSDHARRDRSRRVVELELSPFHEPAINDTQATIALLDELERGLRQLSSDQRAVLVLTYYLDLPLAEAAQALDIPVGTMKSRLVRARSALRAALAAQERTTQAAKEQLA